MKIKETIQPSYDEDEHALTVLPSLECIDPSYGFFVGGVTAYPPDRVCGVEDDPPSA